MANQGGDCQEAATRFLSLLDENATRFTFQMATDIEPKPKPDPLARHLDLALDNLEVLTACNSTGAAVWVMVNEGDGNGRSAKNVKRIRAVFADGDGQIQLNQLLQADLEPHIIVESSPGHLQAYWLVDGLAVEQFEGVQRRIAERLGTDSICDPCRVMRVPGFKWRKNPSKPFEVRIVHERQGLPYKPADILRTWPPLQGKTNSKINGETNGALPPYPGQAAIDALLQDATAADYWAQRFNVTPADDRSPSGWDLAFAGWLARQGHDRDAIAGYLRAYRLHHAPGKGKQDRQDYIWTTVDRAIGEQAEDEDGFGTDSSKTASEKPNEIQARLRLVPPSEMDWRGAQLNLVKGILGFGMMALLYGESGSAKTLIAISLALHVALGRTWYGRKTKKGFVAYLAPEGGHSVHLRYHAWCRYHGVDPRNDRLPFRTIPVRVDLCKSETDLGTVIGNIRAAEADLGSCILIVVDTVSRALAGSDENSSEAMGRFVVNCDRLREEIGATVLGVHHTPRGGNTPRGHSSLQNGAEIRLHARKVATGLFALETEHLKDGEAGEDLMFSLCSVVVGTNDDGEEVNGGLVVKAGITSAGAPGRPPHLTDRQLRILQELSKEAAVTKRWEWSTDEFNEMCVRSGAIDFNAPDSSKRRIRAELRQQLANKGYITIAGDTIRLVRQG